MPPLTRKQFCRHADRSPEADPSRHALKDAKNTPSLLNLPLELQSAIVEYLPRPSDMETLCLVSKDLHALTLPYLYRDVVLLANMSDSKFASMFTQNHSGLSHIRTLRIEEHMGWPGFSTDKHLPALCRLLTLIPRNSLRSFELSTTRQVDERLGLLLRIRQRRLTDFLYLSLRPNDNHLIPTADEVGHITCLQLFLSNRQGCTNAGLLLERMTCVTSLSITLSTPYLGNVQGDNCATGRDVIYALFGPDYATRPRAKLKCLRNTSISFQSAGTILHTVVSLDQIEHLHLSQCQNTERLYESFSQLNLSLKSFCDHRNNSKLRVTDEFYMHGGERFDWSTLVSHAPELRFLEVDDCRIDHAESFMDEEKTLPAFRAFCNHASRLQQLSMIGPAIEPETWNYALGLDAFLDCFRQVPTLKLLKLVVRPECLRTEYLEPDEDGYNSEDEMQSSFYCLRDKDQTKLARDQVNAMVNHTFGTPASACPHLVALVVEAFREDGIVLDCGGFIRTKQIDMFGETSYVGVPVEKKAIKYYVPCSEVLEELSGQNLLSY